MNTMLTCGLCGHRFDPAAQPACAKCPINDGCSLVCCPACGASDVDPSQSRLVRWLNTHLSRRSRPAPVLQPPSPTLFPIDLVDQPDRHQTLADISPGRRGQIAGFHATAEAWGERLRAYGVAPGRMVEVLQHTPVTVIRVDQTELAFEQVVARAVWVETAE